MNLIDEQNLICTRFGAPFHESPEHLKVGVSLNVKDGIFPLNGLRHLPKGDTTGWYIWAGDYSSAPDFFVPIHIYHLNEWCPQVLKFLGLAPGWRFLMAPNYLDVWKDNSLVNF
ncbi:hypothetical protein [uncultured Mucilaginibacter sp.]|uniref:immunity protein Imm33 domain-containing protein n=1 Tax=uncultured Mucilaginibacter sp. TaxID=797541 RepID=UPI0025D121C2|nr:hypothetical protein [uncultured Mucilaginibacter sp.]